jgi:hypothetical protein
VGSFRGGLLLKPGLWGGELNSVAESCGSRLLFSLEAGVGSMNLLSEALGVEYFLASDCLVWGVGDGVRLASRSIHCESELL